MAGALELAVSLVSDRDGVRLGDLWTPWQHGDARAVLAPEPGDPRQHWLSRPKGGSKDTDTAAYMLGWLIEEAGEHDDAYVIASDEDQANRLLDRARGFIRRSRLGAVVRIEATSIVNVRTLARVHALAADVAGGEGLLSPFIVCNEVPNWAETATAKGMWTVAVSSIPKWPGMTFVVIGHAGSPSHWSAKVREYALSSPAWRVREVPGPLPWYAPEVLEEQRGLLPASEFARRHLNEWAESEDAAFGLDDVAACCVLDGPLDPVSGRRYVVSVDLGWRHDNTAVAVAHRESAGDSWKVVVDKLEVFRPGGKGSELDLGVIEQRVVELARRYRPSKVVFDPAQLISSAQRWRKAGLSVTEHTFSVGSNTKLALRLLELVRAHRLVLPDDDDLADELSRIRIVERGPGLFKVDVAPGGDGHGDRTVAVGMAALALGERAPTGRASLGPTRPMGSIRDGPPPPTLDDLRCGLNRGPFR